MKVIQTCSDFLAYRQAQCSSTDVLGLVPTMGALHQGHLELVRQCVEECDVSVVSIFVNPLQFNDPIDFEKYPRPLEQDIKLLNEAGVDVVFAPQELEMYPTPPLTSVDFGGLATVMEGKFRPGHFEGMGIVVLKLLNQIRPKRAYFGLKDIQQYFLVRRMVSDFSVATEIIGVPIIREPSGLARSSRNALLSTQGKAIAANIYKGLDSIKEKLGEGNTVAGIKLDVLSFYSQVEGLSIEYLEFVDPTDLSSLDDSVTGGELVACVAGYVEGVRLIDNLYLRQD